MNIELLEYCLKGLRKRWKEVLRTSVVIFIAFTFVAGTLIFQSNMYKWQIYTTYIDAKYIKVWKLVCNV